MEKREDEQRQAFGRERLVEIGIVAEAVTSEDSGMVKGQDGEEWLEYSRARPAEMGRAMGARPRRVCSISAGNRVMMVG